MSIYCLRGLKWDLLLVFAETVNTRIELLAEAQRGWNMPFPLPSLAMKLYLTKTIKGHLLSPAQWYAAYLAIKCRLLGFSPRQICQLTANILIRGSGLIADTVTDGRQRPVLCGWHWTAHSAPCSHCGETLKIFRAKLITLLFEKLK